MGIRDWSDNKLKGNRKAIEEEQARRKEKAKPAKKESTKAKPASED